jgi:hypothetical protein
VVIRHAEYTRARLKQTSQRLRDLVYPETRPLDELLVSPAAGRIERDEALGLAYRPADPGERFGPLWATCWFRGSAAVPVEWRARRIDLLWESPAAGTLWLDGVAAQGLNRHHCRARLVDEAEGGYAVSFEVELACNGLFGKLDHPVELQRAERAAPRRSARREPRRCAVVSCPRRALGHSHRERAGKERDVARRVAVIPSPHKVRHG